MSFWGTLALYAGTAIFKFLAFSGNERRQDAKAEQFGADDLPIAEEGGSIPVLYGRNRVRNLNLISMGRTLALPVRERVSTGPLTSRGQTIAHKYGGFFILAIGLGSGSTRRLRRVWLADEVVLDQVLDADAEYADVNLTELWGGKGEGGGVQGRFRFYTGSFTQASSNIIPSGATGTIHPSYRGQMVLELGSRGSATNSAGYWVDAFLFGENPHLPPITVEVDNIPDALGYGAVGSEGDVNPAEVIYDLLTDPWVGAGLGTSTIDTASFQAAASTLETEGHGMSIAIYKSQPVIDIVREIADQINAEVYQDPEDRKLKIKLIRDDYTVGSLPLLDETNVVKASMFQQGQWRDTFNQVQVEYEDRDFGYQKRTVVEHNMANFLDQGSELKPVRINRPGIKTRELALRVCSRELKAVSLPLAKVVLIANREAQGLRRGDAIRWSWPEYGISEMVMRVRSIDIGDLEDGRVKLDCVRDIFDTDRDVFGVPEDLQPEAPPDPVAISDYLIRPMPRFFLKRAVALGADVSFEFTRGMYLAKNPAIGQRGFIPEVESDSGEFARDRDFVPFNECATVETAYPKTLEPYDTSTGLVIENVENPSKLDNATPFEIETYGANLICVAASGGDNNPAPAHEWIAYESATDNGDGTYTLNNVWRGLLDTAPIDHAVGAVVFLDPTFGNMGSLRWETDGVFDPYDVRLRTHTGLKILPEAGAPHGKLIPDRVVKTAYPPSDVYVNGSKNPAAIYDLNVQFEFKTRDYDADKMYRGDDTSQSTGDDHGHFLAWTGFGDGLTTQEFFDRIDAEVFAVADQLSGSEDVRGWGHPVRGKLGPNIELLAGGFRFVYSEFQDRSEREVSDWPFTISGVMVPYYLQLLPSFDDRPGLWEDPTSSGADFQADTEAQGGAGNVLVGVNCNVAEVEREIDVSAMSPDGQRVRLLWYAKRRNSDTDDQAYAEIEALDADGSVLSQQNSGYQNPSNSEWTRYVTDLNPLPTGTRKLRVILQSDRDDTGDTDSDAMIDGVDMRMALGISGYWLNNANFGTGDLTGWSQITGSWAADDVSGGSLIPVCDGYFVRVNDGGTAAVLEQERSLWGTAEPGDVVHVQFHQGDGFNAGYDEGRCVVEFRDSAGGTVVDSAATEWWTPPANDVFYRRNLYAEIPSGATHFAVRLEARLPSPYTTGDRPGSSANRVSFDEVLANHLQVFKDTLNSKVDGLVSDPGFEDYLNSDWQLDSGGVAAVGSYGGLSPKVGSWFLVGADGVASFEVYQDIAIPSGYGAGDLVKLGIWRANAAVDDTGEVVLEARNASETVLDSDTTGSEEITPTDAWVERTLSLDIPSGATKLRIRLIGTRVAGTRPDACFDEVSLALYDRT